jgi:hypothetical protein
MRVHSLQNGHRINAESLESNAPAVDFDTQTKWTIPVDNRDDTPLELEAVRPLMLERSLCFEAIPNARYAFSTATRR